MVLWRVYYGDDTTYSDEDGSIEHIPRRNVQAIAQVDDSIGFHLVTGNDYYWYENGLWYGGDKFGLYDYLCRDGYKIILFGRTLLNDEYHAVVEKARKDPDIPRKSAWRSDERKP